MDHFIQMSGSKRKDRCRGSKNRGWIFCQESSRCVQDRSSQRITSLRERKDFARRKGIRMEMPISMPQSALCEATCIQRCHHVKYVPEGSQSHLDYESRGCMYQHARNEAGLLLCPKNGSNFGGKFRAECLAEIFACV